MDLLAARKATRLGATFGLINTAIGLLLLLYANTNPDADDFLAASKGPLPLFGAFLLGILSFGVLRHSRLAAIALLIASISGSLSLSAELGTRPVGLTSLVLWYFYVRAIEGAFTYHQLRDEAGPSHRPIRRWILLFFGPSPPC